MPRETMTGGYARGLARPRSLLSLLPTAAAVLGLVSLLLSVQTSRVTTSGYDIRRLEQVRQEWRDRNHVLEAEISSLKSLDRVEREAKEVLKMVPATRYIYVVVEEAAPSGAATLPRDQQELTEPPPWWRVLWRRIIPWD